MTFLFRVPGGNMLANDKLWAPKSIGELKVDPVIIIDTREQTPLAFSRLRSERGTLTTADYSLKSLEHAFAIEERKTISDLINCCTTERERFEKELLRLGAYRFRRLLIVGTEEQIREGQYRSAARPQSILGSLYAWQARFDVPLVFVASPSEASVLIERWTHYFAREYMLTAARLARGAGEHLNLEFQPSSL